ncbi:MAG: DUF5606 domain-containing protein [Saprospiraceae bacterium]|nr:DUF5606 domain-containing protein [Saprospiraceae bacterium]
MNLKDLIAVSGISGVFKIAGNRNNGLIIEDLDTGKKKFAPSRRHQFTPLESIAIYTDDDSTELSKVFSNMMDQLEDNPPVNPNSKPEELREYFADVLPDFDRDQVSSGDIKKVIKWFIFLNERNLLSQEEEEVEETKEAE